MKATSKHNRPPAAAFHAITVVWGHVYLELFLGWCIPNQLGEGNIAALPPGSRYRILTRAMHVADIQAHPAVQALARVIAVDVVAVPELDGVDRPDPARRGDARYELMTVCHQQAIGDALRVGAALIFLAPDIIVSAGTFAAVVQRHRAGCRAVVCTGLRLDKERFLQSLDAHAGAGALAPRDLVRLALPHLHEHTRAMLLDATAFSTFPVAVYWRVGLDGLLARSFHLHPLMLDPMNALVMPRGTVDGDYLARACPDRTRIHVVTDSDEFVLFELSRAVPPRGKDVPPARRRGDLARGVSRGPLRRVPGAVLAGVHHPDSRRRGRCALDRGRGDGHGVCPRGHAPLPAVRDQIPPVVQVARAVAPAQRPVSPGLAPAAAAHPVEAGASSRSPRYGAHRQAVAQGDASVATAGGSAAMRAGPVTT